MSKEIISFVVPGEPKGKARPRFNGYSRRAYTPKETMQYENNVKHFYSLEHPEGMFVEEGPVLLEIIAYYGIPKSVTKKKREAMISGEIRPTKKPDIDNIIKIIADSLNKLAYYDDSQVVKCSCEKYYSELPRVEVYIKRID